METKKDNSPDKVRDTANKTEKTESEERFVRDLLIRGEASEPLPNGELPPGATHKIIENNEDGDLPEVERERFSIC